LRSNIFKGVAFVVFLIGAILESAHYFDLIDRMIPAWLAPLINERVNFVLMTVGLLIFLLSFFERRLGHSDDPNDEWAQALSSITGTSDRCKGPRASIVCAI
jgi:hypothetical protein